MHTASVTTAELSKSRGAKTCIDRSKTCTISRLQAAVSELIYQHNPRKAWAFVADLFDLKERAAKNRLSNSASYTIEELQILFQSEDGRAYLEAMMDDAEPEWWRAVRASIQLSDARRLQAEAQQKVLALDNAPLEQPTRRKMKRFLDADRTLNATRAEKELAAGILHQNVGRSLDRGVAQTQAAPAKRAYAGRGR